VEQLIILLRGKPVAVGGSENRGVVAASYAEEIWCKSAMSGFIAKKNCPDLILLAHVLIVTKKFRIKFRVFLRVWIWSSRH
jgi:nucleotidyltransferase/DNA polymerase involved in DNA repair